MLSASWLDYLKSWPLVILPHQLLSRLVRYVTRCPTPWLKNLLIRRFITTFDVDMGEAELAEPAAYPDFNSFFTRALRAGIRPMPEQADAVACPVDGSISQFGNIASNRLLQAKGSSYSLEALLGGETPLADRFLDGSFITLYLSPRDYHRIHMPADGTLLQTTYIPGRLYSVAPHTTRAVPGLFTRNERLVCLFDSVHGPMAVILVGAIFVSCMETVWSGVVNPRMGMTPHKISYGQADGDRVWLARGEELGRFNMGSTVILLFARNRIAWSENLASAATVRTGNPLAYPATGSK